MAERKLSLVILGKATGALSALKATGDGAQTLGKKVTDLLPSFKTIALAGAAAFAAVGAAAFKAVQAAAEDQESQRRLAEQLKRTTGATDDQIASVEKLIAAQEIAVGVTDTELRGALGNLVRATNDVGLAQNQLSLALDISAATGKDLEGVSLALGKAFTGNIGALTKLGIPLDQSVIKSKNLTEVVSTLNKQFSGAAAAAADTFSGRMRILRISLENVVESIGYALLPMAEKMLKAVQERVVPVLTAFATALQDGQGVRGALVAAGAAAGDFGLKVIDALEPVVKAFVTLSNTLVIIAKPMLYVLGAVASAIVLIATRSFEAYRETAQTFRNTADNMDNLRISTDDATAAFQRFRDDVVKAGAATALTQDQLRALEQQARQMAAGTANVVQPFIGPLLAGYGASAAAATGATSAAEQFKKQLAEMSGAASGAKSKVESLADAMKKFGTVVERARDATRSATEASKGVEKAQGTLAAKTDAVTKAQERFDTVVRGFPATARESIDAARRFADAQKAVRDSGFQVADAVRNVQKAEQALADLRAKVADAQKVASAERTLERSKYGVEEANFRVIDAERELAELRTNPDASPIEIRRAEIALAQAKLAVFDSVQAVADAERNLETQRNVTATADEIADAERNLERAKWAVTDAIDAQTRATTEQSDAQQHLNEITYGATVGSVMYDKALRDLEDAKKDQQEASESLTAALQREADAVRDLLAAQKALAAAQAAIKPAAAARVAAGLGVTLGAGGTISESVAAISGTPAAGGTSSGTVNIRVETSPFTNPVEVGTEIVDAISAYVRSNGQIPIPVGAFLGVI